MTNTFEGFAHSAEQVSTYIYCLDIFILALTTQEIIRHKATDPTAFREWLMYNGIKDVTDEMGAMVRSYYFGNNHHL